MEFGRELKSLTATKKVSASKITTLTKLASNSVTIKVLLKDPASVSAALRSFLLDSPNDCLLSGLYVIDAILKVKDAKTAEYSHLLSNVLVSTSESLAKIPKAEHDRVKKLILVWKKGGTFSGNVLDQLQDAMSEKPREVKIQMPPPNYRHPRDPRTGQTDTGPSTLNGLTTTLNNLVDAYMKNPSSTETLTAISLMLPMIQQGPNVSIADQTWISQLSSELNVKLAELTGKKQYQPFAFDYDEEDGSSLMKQMSQAKNVVPSPNLDYKLDLPKPSPTSYEPPTRRAEPIYAKPIPTNDTIMGEDGTGPKNLPSRFDSSVPADCIRVMSRTLYCGGINGAVNTQNLRKLFETVGRVETIQINYPKFNAFIKMYTREEAIKAKDELKGATIDDRAVLKIGWGCGFGPKDLFDYATGSSTIPIARLSDNEKRWMVSSKRGGGSLEGGQIVEEPDVNIGPKKDTASGEPTPISPPVRQASFEGLGRGRGRGRVAAGIPRATANYEPLTFTPTPDYGTYRPPMDQYGNRYGYPPMPTDANAYGYNPMPTDTNAHGYTPDPNAYGYMYGYMNEPPTKKPKN